LILEEGKKGVHQQGTGLSWRSAKSAKAIGKIRGLLTGSGGDLKKEEYPGWDIGM